MINKLPFTAEKLKRSITSEMIEAGINVIGCMTKADTIRPIVHKYKNKILSEKKYHIADKYKNRCGIQIDYVSSHELTYLLSDSDAEEYFSLCDIEKEKAGFEDLPDGFCPLLVAEHDVVVAEWELMDAYEPITGINKSCIHGINRKKYLDLLLKITVNCKRS